MVMFSMNGRPIIASAPSPLLQNVTVQATSTVSLTTQVLIGDSATVLQEVARRFNATVEPLTTFFGWRSLATNTASGGIPDSNHMSGTAIDLNGGKHPRYRTGTFSGDQVAAIRKILADLPGVKWGGDYPVSEIDQMHFEIVGTPAVIATTAAKIRAAQAPPRPTPAPVAPKPVQPAVPTRPRRHAMHYQVQDGPNAGTHFIVTDVNVQIVEPAYVDTATVQWGPAVPVNAATITQLYDLTGTNRKQSRDA